MGSDSTAVMVGIATSQGRRGHNADATAEHGVASTGILAVAVVDGTGSTAEVAETMPLVAQVAARYGCRYGAMPGVLAATAMLADPVTEFPEPDGVMVLAVIRPGEPIVIAHVGDCRAYGWTESGELHRLTVDHTKGQRLRHEGVTDQEAAGYDHVVINSIARATVGTVALVETFDPRVILTSDGVHSVLTEDAITTIAREHDSDPQSCAEALVTAARETSPRDDATAAVIVRPAPVDRGDALEGR
jgi:hypothetical protein